MTKRKSPNASVVESVSKPNSEELLEFLEKWHRRQWPELWRQLQGNLLPLNIFQALIEHRNPFEVLADYEHLLKWHSAWPRFWRAFGFNYDHEALVLPDYRPGFGWSIVTPDLANWPTGKLLHEVGGRMFKTWQYYDDEKLDKVVSPQEPTTTHVVLVRDQVEADEGHKNKSANDIKQTNIPVITLRQRIVLEARYFFETNQHLDLVNLTLCAGSLYADGFVPGAYRLGGKFFVGRVFSDGAIDFWRVREVVSL